MVQSRKSKKALSTGLMLAMVAMAISASNAATLTFTGGAGTGNFHDVENWDGKSVPTSSDQVIIKEGSTVSLSQAAKVGALKVQKGATLNVQSALEFISGLTVDEGSFVNLINGTLEAKVPPSSFANITTYPTVTVNGQLRSSNGTISGSNETRSSPTLALNVGRGGSLRLSGQDNKLLFVKASVNGEFVWGKLDEASSAEEPAQDLTLHISQVEILGEGKAKLVGSSLQRLSSSDDTSKIALNGGSLEIHGKELPGTTAVVQTVDVPVFVSHGRTLHVKASADRSNFVRLTGGLNVDGVLSVTDNAQLTLGPTAHNFSSTSTTQIADGAAVYVEGPTSWLGQLNASKAASGSLVVQAPLSFAGTGSVNELFLLGGDVTLGSDDIALAHSPSLEVGKQVYMDAGSILGAGEGPAREVHVRGGAVFTVDGESATNKSLKNVAIILDEKASMVVSQGATLTLGDNGKIKVFPGASANLSQASSIKSTANANTAAAAVGSVELGPGAQMNLLVGTAPTVIDASIRGLDGAVVVSGAGAEPSLLQSVVFQREFEPSTIQVVDGTYAKVVFDCSKTSGAGASSGSKPESVLPRSIVARSGDLELKDCVAVSAIDTNWDLSGLTLANSVLATASGSGGMIKTSGAVQLGTAEGAPGIITGSGTLDSTKVVFYAGSVAVDRLALGAGGLTVRGASEKTVAAREVLVQQNSVVDVENGSKFTVSNDGALWHFGTGSRLNVGPGAHIGAVPPAKDAFNEKSDPESIRPQFWLDHATMVLGDPSGADKTPGVVDVFVRSSGSAIHTTSGSRGEILGGLVGEDTSSSASSIVIADDSVLVLGSKNGLPLVPGSIVGPNGHLVIGKGPFNVPKPISVGKMTIEDGAAGVFEKGCSSQPSTGAFPDNGNTVVPIPLPVPGTDLPVTTPSTVDPAIRPATALGDEDICSSKSDWLGADATTTSWAFFGTSIFFILATCGLGGYIAYDKISSKKKQEEGAVDTSHRSPLGANASVSGAVESRDQD